MPVTNEGIQQDFCDKCLTVVKHAGTPKGKTIEVALAGSGGTGATTKHKVYGAIPDEGKYNVNEAIIMCTDIFGLSLVNNLLIADAFAENGIQCYIPDYLNGDPVPQDVKTNPERAKTFSMQDWRTRHTAEHTRPALDALLQHLRQEKGVTKIYGIGYCFGARYIMDLIFENKLSKAAFAHPSQLRVPEDFGRLVEIHKEDKNGVPPLLFLTCEKDPQFPKEAQEKADEILSKLNDDKNRANVNGKELYKRVYYPGNEHGFAVRGDTSQQHIKEAKEDAFKQALEWFSTS